MADFIINIYIPLEGMKIKETIVFESTLKKKEEK